MERIFVVGAGFMGSGIAQVCAQAGYPTHLMDVDPKALEKARSGIEWSVEKLWTKDLLKDRPEIILKRIQFEQDLANAGKADWASTLSGLSRMACGRGRCSSASRAAKSASPSSGR